MAVEITPLGFQKPDGTESIRNGDDVISNNAQRSQDLLSDARARLANVENAAGFTGGALGLNDSAVSQAVATGTETNAQLELKYVTEASAKGAYDNTAARLSGVDSRFTGVDSQFASVDDRFSGVDSDIADLSDQMDTINFPAAGTHAVTVGGVRRDVGVYQKYSAFPTVVKLPDTRLYLVWYEATDHMASRDGIVRASYSVDNGVTWGPAFTALSVAGKDVRDPSVSVGADGTVYLTYFTGSATNAAEGFFIRKSTDNGLTYGAATRIDTHEYAGGCAPAVPFFPWVETHRNYTLNPRAVTSTGWNYQLGTGEASTLSLESGAGPNNIPNFIRRTISTAKTGGNSGWYRNEAISGVSGDVWTVSAWIRSSVAVEVGMNLTFRLDAATVNSTPGPKVTLSPGVWTRYSATLKAAGSYNIVQGWAILTGGAIVPAGGTLDVTQMFHEKNVTVAGEYFDGATPEAGGSKYAWTGTANASASIQRNQSSTENLLATWYGKVLTTDARDSVWAATSSDGGSTWTAPAKLVDGIAPGRDMQEPWAVFQDENVVITYRDGNSANIGVVKSTNSGSTWGAGATAFPGTGRPGTVLTANGTLVCVYRSLGSGMQQHGLMRTSRDLGTTWTGPRLVETTVSNYWVYSGLVENSPGQMLCVSAVESSTTSTQMSSRYLTEGSGISPFGDTVPPQANRAVGRLRQIAAVDDFDHAARTFTDGSWTLDGKRWNTDGSATITDGVLQDATANGAHAHWVKTLSTSHEVEAEMQWTANAGIALLCRLQDTSNYLMATVETGGVNARIYKVVDGVATQLATATVSVPAGVWHKFKFVVTGNDLRFFIEDIMLVSASDATFNNQGGAGIRTGAAAASTVHKVRNFVARRRTEINT